MSSIENVNENENAVKKKQGFAKIPHDFRERLWKLSGACLKVYMAHKLSENRNGISYPSLETLGKLTGLSRTEIWESRRWLIQHGWLAEVERKRGKRGTFGVAVYRTAMPATTSGKDGLGTTSGKPGRGRAFDQYQKPGLGTTSGKPGPEVDVETLNLEVDERKNTKTAEVDSKSRGAEVCLPDYIEPKRLKAFLDTRTVKPDLDSLLEVLAAFHEAGHDVTAILRDCAATGKPLPDLAKQLANKRRFGLTEAEHEERFQNNLRTAGLCREDYEANVIDISEKKAFG